MLPAPRRGGVIPTSGALPGVRVDPQSAALRAEIRDRWLRAKRNRSRNTAEAYERDLATYFEWCDSRGFEVFTILPSDVERYVEWLQTTDNVGRYRSKPKPRSAATVARMVTAVSSFYAYAVKHTEGKLRNPVDLIDRPRSDTTAAQTRALSLEDVARLRDAARSNARDYALLQLLLGTGIRVSELCQADTSDLGTDSGHVVLTVTRKGGKKGKVPVPPGAADALRRYIGSRRGPLFILRNRERMNRRMVAYRLERIAMAAFGPKEAREIKLTPHKLRHTAATLALDAGASLRDVQVQLGHSRPETTARYDDARRELNNAASRALAAVVADEEGAP